MCIIEILTEERPDGSVVDREYTRLCSDSVNGKTCENSVIKDRGLGYPSTMRNDRMAAPEVPTSIEVASSTGGRKSKYPQGAWVMPKKERRTSYLSSLFGGGKKERRTKYPGPSRLPEAPEPPSAAGEGRGAPPPPPRSQSFSAQITSGGTGAQPQLDYARVPARPNVESLASNYQRVPASGAQPVLHQHEYPANPFSTSKYRSDFLPPEMSPIDTHFSSSAASPSRHSSPHAYGPQSLHGYSPVDRMWHNRGPTPDTPLDAPTSPKLDRGFAGRARGHQATRSYDPQHPQTSSGQPFHRRTASESLANRPPHFRGQESSNRRATSTKPDIHEDVEDMSERDRAESRTRQREENKRREARRTLRQELETLENKIAQRKEELAQLRNEQSSSRVEAGSRGSSSSAGTQRTTARPGSSHSTARASAQPRSGPSRNRSDPSEDPARSPTSTHASWGQAPGDTEDRIEQLQEIIHALQLRLDTLERGPVTPSEVSSAPPASSQQHGASSRARPAQVVRDDDEFTHIDSGESTHSSGVARPHRKPPTSYQAARGRRDSTSGETRASSRSTSRTIRPESRNRRPEADVPSDSYRDRRSSYHERERDHAPSTAPRRMRSERGTNPRSYHDTARDSDRNQPSRQNSHRDTQCNAREESETDDAPARRRRRDSQQSEGDPSRQYTRRDRRDRDNSRMERRVRE